MRELLPPIEPGPPPRWSVGGHDVNGYARVEYEDQPVTTDRVRRLVYGITDDGAEVLLHETYVGADWPDP